MRTSPLFRRQVPRWVALAGVLLLSLYFQLALVLIPGYFSHDELMWGVQANVPRVSDLPWVRWLDVGTFQWRPLTFNLWLPLSHLLFDKPMAFHLLWVMLGSGIATAFSGLLLRLGSSKSMALLGGVAFVLNPYAAYVHGWVGTLADLLWVAIALGLAHVVLCFHQRGRAGLPVATAAFVLTSLALMAKEAAVVIPALLAATWLLGQRSRTLAWASLASGLAVGIYLALRLGVLMHPAGDGYAVSPGVVPRNLAAFVLFPLRPSSFEVQSFLPVGAAQLLVSTLAWVGLLWIMRRRSPRLAALLMVGAPLALAPALPLEVISNQYAYGASAWAVGCIALAGDRMSRAARWLPLALMVVACWHGQKIQSDLVAIGQRQQTFHGALADLLPMSREPLKLYVPEKDAWLYRRLTHDVPAWRGVAIAGRIQWVPRDEAPFLVQPDGSLAPAEALDRP